MSRMPYRRLSDQEAEALGLPRNRNGYSVKSSDPTHLIDRDSWHRVRLNPAQSGSNLSQCPPPWPPEVAAHYC